MAADKKAKIAEAINDPENQERWNKFKQEADAEDARREAAARAFDPRLLMERAGKIHEVDHPILGTLRFGELTFEDSFEINKCKTDVEKTELVAYLMMSKAYPGIPKDFLKRMPLIEGAALIDFLTKQPVFLSSPKNSRGGSKATRRRKASA